jgi:hypothetical protein
LRGWLISSGARLKFIPVTPRQEFRRSAFEKAIVDEEADSLRLLIVVAAHRAFVAAFPQACGGCPECKRPARVLYARTLMPRRAALSRLCDTRGRVSGGDGAAAPPDVDLNQFSERPMTAEEW